ncbi:hypothetical protein [Hungatella sp.]|jgi:hypothetical protein|uniref:hypothetical protein n=1 Tax=Hungatella sp. TaxID=2613924 RepID=UPI003991E4F4
MDSNTTNDHKRLFRGDAMIMINEQWEEAETIDDCLKLIRENMGEEFTEKVKEIFALDSDNEKQIRDAIYEVESAIGDMEDALRYLEALV